MSAKRFECHEVRAATDQQPVKSELSFLTREELAGVLKVSVRTVDAMLESEELPCVRLHGVIVRFYLPDVVRHLLATAGSRKHARNGIPML